jgi:hypothetical protein
MRTRSTTPRLFAAALVLAAASAGCTSISGETAVPAGNPAAEDTSDTDGGAGSTADSCYNARPFTYC